MHIWMVGRNLKVRVSKHSEHQRATYSKPRNIIKKKWILVLPHSDYTQLFCHLKWLRPLNTVCCINSWSSQTVITILVKRKQKNQSVKRPLKLILDQIYNQKTPKQVNSISASVKIVFRFKASTILIIPSWNMLQQLVFLIYGNTRICWRTSNKMQQWHRN